MPQAEANTLRQHNVPVQENMSRGSYKKTGPCSSHKDGYRPGDPPRAFTCGLVKWLTELVTPSLIGCVSRVNAASCQCRRRNLFRRCVVCPVGLCRDFDSQFRMSLNDLRPPQKTPEFSHIAGSFIRPFFGIVNATRLSRKRGLSRALHAALHREHRGWPPDIPRIISHPILRGHLTR
jgi:hypothetical protein